MPKNISYVPKNGLCTGCGACVSICPTQCISINMDEGKGIFYPKVGEEVCDFCGLCLNICPGVNADFNRGVPENWLSLPYHPYIGYYSSIYLGFTNNEELQFNGASGGMVTAFLLYLFKENLIDGAVVTKMNESNALRAEPFIARTKEELIMAQKSKYCPVPLGEILKELENQSGHYAIVGLPCHINSIRNIKKYRKEIENKISFLIGLFCSRTPSFNATLYLLKKKGISLDEVSLLEYRGQGHPGFMTIRLKSGKLIRIPHLDYDYWGYMFYKFFIPSRCYLCPDKLAALADISMGDNWSHSLKHPSGSSTIIVRKTSCTSIIEKMEINNLITLRKIDLDLLIKSQDLDNKCKISPRVKLWNFIGGSSPDYGKLELVRKNTLLDILSALPQFIRFLLTRRKRNYYILKSLARVLWAIDKTKQRFLQILEILRKISVNFYRFYINALIPTKKHSLVKKSRYKIVMVGGFGSRDIGDEAMPHADRMNLRELLGGELEIIMLSPDPDYTNQFHAENSIKDLSELGHTPITGLKDKILNFNATLCSLFFILATFIGKYGIHLRLWPSARHVLNELASCDLVFNVGGGNLNSIIPQELYKKGTLYLASHILRKPVILSGQTMGPFTNWFDRVFVKLCLNKVHMITFRDKEISHTRLKKIGVSKPIMLDAADDAMTIPCIDQEKARSILRKEVGGKWYDLKTNLTIAMNLKGSLRLFKRSSEISSISRECNLMAEIADVIIEKFKGEIVFIPTDYCPGVDDIEIHKVIMRQIKNKDFVRAVEGEYDDTILKGLIGLFDVAIGARYHFCVFAASMYVPFLGIASGVYQQTKLKGLADLCQLPQCFVQKDMEFVTIKEVLPQVERIIKERENIRKKLQDIIPVLKEKSLYAVKEAVKLLRKE